VLAGSDREKSPQEPLRAIALIRVEEANTIALGFFFQRLTLVMQDFSNISRGGVLAVTSVKGMSH